MGLVHALHRFGGLPDLDRKRFRDRAGVILALSDGDEEVETIEEVSRFLDERPPIASVMGEAGLVEVAHALAVEADSIDVITLDAEWVHALGPPS